MRHERGKNTNVAAFLQTLNVFLFACRQYFAKSRRDWMELCVQVVENYFNRNE
jgi:hypothetical protein